MSQELFEESGNRGKKKKTLNILPENPDATLPRGMPFGRFPKWLHRKMPEGGALWQTDAILNKQRLPTVCEEAKCPNLLECWSKKTATFLAMGKACTRNCGFCSIDFSKTPQALAGDEPLRLSESVKELGLKHVVITMVARDDLPDGGSGHLAAIIEEVRKNNPGVTIEVLTSDFEGNLSSIQTVLKARPDIFNHNIETVRSLTPRVRHKATYDRTLEVLKAAKTLGKNLYIKSGFMVGLGESEEEAQETIYDLFKVGCSIITIGQYLQPSRQKLLVKKFITPEQFEKYAEFGRALGVSQMVAGPFVRSSYHAGEIFNGIKQP